MSTTLVPGLNSELPLVACPRCGEGPVRTAICQSGVNIGKQYWKCPVYKNDFSECRYSARREAYVALLESLGAIPADKFFHNQCIVPPLRHKRLAPTVQSGFSRRISTRGWQKPPKALVLLGFSCVNGQISREIIEGMAEVGEGIGAASVQLREIREGMAEEVEVSYRSGEGAELTEGISAAMLQLQEIREGITELRQDIESARYAYGRACRVGSMIVMAVAAVFCAWICCFLATMFNN